MKMSTTDNHTQYEQLVSFIREQIREFKMDINRSTQIETDLGVTGDDADELLVAFSRRFKVDTSNFIFANYFNDEPHLFSKDRSIKSFTVGHLEKAIAVGKLDEDVINN